MAFNIVTWNINSVRLRAELVCKLLKSEKIDILCLQECKSPVEKIPIDRFEEIGFPLRKNSRQKRPSYNFKNRVPFWDTRDHAGFYTKFGNVFELLEKSDNSLAIFGPGEGIRIKFKASSPPKEGYSRRYILKFSGWCKDRDLFTRNGSALNPIPRNKLLKSSNILNKKYNTRYQSGRN